MRRAVCALLATVALILGSTACRGDVSDRRCEGSTLQYKESNGFAFKDKSWPNHPDCR